MNLHEIRRTLAAAVGNCLPYPPDSVVAPMAWIDTLTVDFEQPLSMGGGRGEAVIVAAGQRNDRVAALEALEGDAPGILDALESVPWLRVTSLQSGRIEVGQQTLPAVLYTTDFHLPD